MNLRKFVREFPVLGNAALSLYVFLKRGSALRLLRPQNELSNFWPNSDGRYRSLTHLLITSLNNLPDYFDELIEEASGKAPEQSKPIGQVFPGDFAHNVEKLKGLFQSYGSDKHTHKYEEIYARLFEESTSVLSIVEIGIGTNNEKVVSHMGKNHQGSGGSLRAFRDFYPNAQIVGLDIDYEAMFQENRISTFFFDQNGAVDQLSSLGIGASSVDLFIDDGLHLFGANIRGLIHGLHYTRSGGWIAIEDLTDSALGAWRIVAIALNSFGHEAHLIQAQGAHILLVQKALKKT